MATKKSKSNADQPETVLVPVIRTRYFKAPAIDPHLRPESITVEKVTVCGYELPPIQSGIQPGQGFKGEPCDYPVRVIWIGRRQVEEMMAAVSASHPELGPMLQVMKAYLCCMDSLRDGAKHGMLAASGWTSDDEKGQYYRRNLEGVARALGNWNDERRLHLY